jgi:ATP-dependent RNA helicase DDX51/DBP6
LCLGLEPLPQPARTPKVAYKATFDSLPLWLAKPSIVSPAASVPFADLGLSTKLIENLRRKDYLNALAVQSGVLPLLLPGSQRHQGDMCVSAPTGSGKTLAYILPMIEAFKHKLVTSLRGIVIVPTRELVAQAREVAELCASSTGVKIGTAVGNISLAAEQEILVRKGQKFDPAASRIMHDDAKHRIGLGYAGDDSLLEDVTWMLPDHVPEYSSTVDILICTPGRLVDHIRSTAGFSLTNVEWLVIDEADKLLDQSFQDWVEVLLRALHPILPVEGLSARERLMVQVKGKQGRRKVQKVILSATMTRDLSKLASLKFERPRLVVVAEEDINAVDPGADETPLGATPGQGFELPASLTEVAIPVGNGSDKPLFLLKLLQDVLCLDNNGDIQDSSSSSISDLKSESDSNSDTDTDTGNGSDSDSDPDSDSDADVSSTSSGSTNSSSSGNTDSNSTRPANLQVPVTSRKANILKNVLVFTNDNENATRLRHLLSTLHPPFGNHMETLTKSSATSHGRKTLNAFRAGRIQILIASDRASRGLDVTDLAYVVNYDMPRNLTSYVHRVGRTARAGREGKAWTFFTRSEARWFWNSIAGGSEIRRGGRSVERMRLEVDRLDEDKTARYQEALEKLQSAVQGKSK